MKELQQILPVEVQTRLREFAEQCVNGQITLNFNQGRIESYESRDCRRVNGRPSVPQVPKVVNPVSNVRR